MTAKPKYVIGILLFDIVEALDFCGPFEVFSTTAEQFKGSIRVFTVAQKELVTARNDLFIKPNYVIGKDEIPKMDVVLIPGGYGTFNELKNESLLDWIKSAELEAQFMMSVCSGVSLLGKCGFLDAMTVTTHRTIFDIVQLDCPNSRLCKCQRFTDNGKFLTSAGVSAGIDLAFYFVKKYLGDEEAKRTAEMMEYDWKDTGVKTCTCDFS